MTLWRGKYLKLLKKFQDYFLALLAKETNSTVETALCLKLSQFSCCWNKTMNWISLWYLVVQLYPWFEFNHPLFIIIIHYHTPKQMKIKSKPNNTICIDGKLTPTLNNQSETCNHLELPFERTKDSFIDKFTSIRSIRGYLIIES